jgi:hypothetical protein
MKVTIEIDMTPEEARELFVPSDQQAELGRQLYQQWFSAVQKSTMDMMNPANYSKGDNND